MFLESIFCGVREVRTGCIDKLGCADVWMLDDDGLGKSRFWVQGQGEARREWNKLNQLFGSGKLSESKQETKSDNTKPVKQYVFAFSRN